MGISFEGIGQWAATFACGEAAVGQVVKISGSGGVKALTTGRSYLVADVDEAAKTVTFAL